MKKPQSDPQDKMQPTPNQKQITDHKRPSLNRKSILIFIVCILLAALLAMLESRRVSHRFIKHDQPKEISEIPNNDIQRESACITDEANDYKNTTNLNLSGKQISLNEKEKRQFNASLTNRPYDSGLKYFKDKFGENIKTNHLAYSEELDMLAYGTIDATENSGTITVRLHNFSNGSSKIIYQESFPRPELSKLETRDYSNDLNFIRFSEDSKLLGISLSERFYVYDTENNDLILVIDKAANASGTSEIAAGEYVDFNFSPDNEKVAIRIGYWEGASYGIIDIDRKTYTPLDYSGYVMGEEVIGWFENKLIVNKYNIDDQYGNKFFLASPIPGSPETPINPNLAKNDVLVEAERIGDTIYFVANSEGDVRVTFCDNNGKRQYDIPEYKSLYAYKVHTGQTQKILTTDMTYTNKSGQGISGVFPLNINGKTRTIISIGSMEYDDTKDVYYLLEDDLKLTLLSDQ